MGRLTTIELVENDYGLDLEQQLDYHLRANHFPPIPSSMVPICIEAIDNANAGEWDKLVSLPEGVGYRGLTVAPTSAIIEQHHLEFWIIESELY